METMSYFDIIIVILVLLLGLKGLIDGFIKEFFGLAGIIGGIYFGSRYAELIGKWISDNIYLIKNEAALTFIGFLVGLFGIWIGMVFLSNLITKLTHASGMGFFNRLLGALFGWAKVFLIFSIIVYAISSIEATKKIIQKYTKNSLLYPLMVETGGYIIKLKPQNLVSPTIQQQSNKAAQGFQTEIKKGIEENITKTITSTLKEQH